MKPYGHLKEGDVVYALETDKYNFGRISEFIIRDLKEYSDTKVQFDVYDNYNKGFKTCVMEKNRRWGEYSPSIEGLEMYWKRTMKRIFKRYKYNREK